MLQVLCTRQIDTKQCPVCFESINGSECVTPCDHTFHTPCLAALKSILRAPVKCPDCQKVLPR